MEPDYGGGWAYRGTTAGGRHLADIMLRDDSDAREWALGLSMEHRGQVVVVERYEATNDNWRQICKAGPTEAGESRPD